MALALSALFAAGAAQARLYDVEEVGYLSGGSITLPFALADGGYVAGTAYTGTTNLPFLYSGGELTTIPFPAGRSDLVAGATIDVNQDGNAVGAFDLADSGAPSVPFVWKNGEVTLLSDLAPGALAALRISDADDVLALTLDGPVVIESDGTVRALSTDAPAAMAKNGLVAGCAADRTVLESVAEFTDLSAVSDRLAGCHLVAGVNDLGHVAVNDPSESFLYDGDVATTLAPLEGAAQAHVTAINAHDQVVGQSAGGAVEPTAVLWEDGAVVRLADVVLPGATCTMQVALDINDDGQILVGAHCDDGSAPAYLLTPTGCGEISSLRAKLGRGGVLAAGGRVSGLGDADPTIDDAKLVVRDAEGNAVIDLDLSADGWSETKGGGWHYTDGKKRGVRITLTPRPRAGKGVYAMKVRTVLGNRAAIKDALAVTFTIGEVASGDCAEGTWSPGKDD